MFFKGEQRSCKAAVSRVISTLTGLCALSDATGTYCRARARVPTDAIDRADRRYSSAAWTVALGVPV